MSKRPISERLRPSGKNSERVKAYLRLCSPDYQTPEEIKGHVIEKLRNEFYKRGSTLEEEYKRQEEKILYQRSGASVISSLDKLGVSHRTLSEEEIIKLGLPYKVLPKEEENKPTLTDEDITELQNAKPLFDYQHLEDVLNDGTVKLKEVAKIGGILGLNLRFYIELRQGIGSAEIYRSLKSHFLLGKKELPDLDRLSLFSGIAMGSIMFEFMVVELLYHAWSKTKLY